LAETLEMLEYVRNIPQEDLDLLDLSNETGVKPLSILFLIVIAERSIMSGDNNEISFKVSVYASRLLQEHFAVDPKMAYRTFRKSYKIRSDLVHAGVINCENVRNLIPGLYEYVTKIRLLTVRYPKLVSAVEKERLLFMEN